MPRPKNPTLPRKIIQNRLPPLKTRGVYANVTLEPVPFDPAIDCPPYACFNCRIVDDHLNQDCTKSVLHKYCENCGRRGLDVFKCPRCSKGYIKQFGEEPYWHGKNKESLVEIPKRIKKKLPVGMTPLPKTTKKKHIKKLSSPSSQVSSETNAVTKMYNSHSTSDSAISSELGDESFNDIEDLDGIVIDEDLDNIVFDESETPLQEQHTSNAVQAIMDLIEVTKHLSMEDQNKILIQFIQTQKNVLTQKND